MKIKKLSLKGPLLIEPKIFYDKRGFLYETWNLETHLKSKINSKIVQVTYTHSKKNVLRGIHFQYPNPQGKLISVINGKIFEELQGQNALEQSLIDQLMINLDGSSNKGNLGANAILSVSIAASKVGADKIAESFYKSFNIPVSIIRPFNCYGPRQSARAVIPTIISQALNKKEIFKKV